MEIGDPVSFELNADVLIIGTLDSIDEEAQTVQVWEAHAYHRLWGGSNGARGQVHTVSAHKLDDCPSNYKHIVRHQQVRREEGTVKLGKAVHAGGEEVA